MSPYRLGLTATYKSEGRPIRLEDLIGPVVYECAPEDLAGSALAEYREVIIKINLSPAEQRQYDELIQTRNDFLRRSGIRLGSLDGWRQFILHSGSPQGRVAMAAHREAKSLAYGTEGKLRVLEEILANHPSERTLIFTDDNRTVYTISRDFLIPAITHRTHVKERVDLLEKFRAGKYRTLVASRILDEGVDVPEASVAVVLSGTATERQHIQRLGHVMRKAEGKSAVLYEVVTEGTTEERVSQQRRGQWQPREQRPDINYEDLNAPH